jgi:hypothetical protein
LQLDLMTKDDPGRHQVQQNNEEASSIVKREVMD